MIPNHKFFEILWSAYIETGYLYLKRNLHCMKVKACVLLILEMYVNYEYMV